METNVYIYIYNNTNNNTGNNNNNRVYNSLNSVKGGDIGII